MHHFSLSASSPGLHQEEELTDVRAQALAAEQQLSALKVAHMAAETEMHALQLCASAWKPSKTLLSSVNVALS